MTPTAALSTNHVQQVTQNDLESLIYMTSGCLEPTGAVSAHTLAVWGLGHGYVAPGAVITDDPERAGGPFYVERWQYPLTAAEAQFIAEENVLPNSAPIDLYLPYSGLVLTPAGPVKVLLPSWEASFVPAGGSPEEYGLPGEGSFDADVRARLEAVQARLIDVLSPLGGTATIRYDEDRGAGPLHEIIAVVPVTAVVNQFGSLPDPLAAWRAYLAPALAVAE